LRREKEKVLRRETRGRKIHESVELRNRELYRGTGTRKEGTAKERQEL